MKRLLWLLPLLFTFHASPSFATPPAQQVIFCNLSTLSACTPSWSAYGSAGPKAANAFGIANANFTLLFDMFGTGSNLATNGVADAADIISLWTGCSGSDPVLGYQGACVSGGGGSGYPGAGIPNSTGSAWGTSYATSGAGSVMLTNGPVFVPPPYATSGTPTCDSAHRGQVIYLTDGSGAIANCNNNNIWVTDGTTPFTMAGTGCTPTAATGDATGGSFTLAAGPCTAVTVTFNGAVGMTAPHMWVCAVSDQTLQAAGTWFGEWGQSSSTTTTAVIPIPPAAGATDVITFNCTPHLYG